MDEDRRKKRKRDESPEYDERDAMSVVDFQEYNMTPNLKNTPHKDEDTISEISEMTDPDTGPEDDERTAEEASIVSDYSHSMVTEKPMSEREAIFRIILGSSIFIAGILGVIVLVGASHGIGLLLVPVIGAFTSSVGGKMVANAFDNLMEHHPDSPFAKAANWAFGTKRAIEDGLVESRVLRREDLSAVQNAATDAAVNVLGKGIKSKDVKHAINIATDDSNSVGSAVQKTRRKVKKAISNPEIRKQLKNEIKKSISDSSLKKVHKRPRIKKSNSIRNRAS